MNANDRVQRRELLELMLAEEGFEVARSEAITPREISSQAPLSFSQQRLWFLHQLDRQSPAYNLSMVVRCKDPLNVLTFEQSLNEIVRRHEILRTRINLTKGQPVQVITAAASWRLPLQDLSTLPPAGREVEIHRLLSEDGQKPFDLEREPLMRTRLLRLDEQDHVLLICMHHIAGDGWSTGVLSRELSSLYESFSAGSPSRLAELPIQYGDFAAWQRDWLQGETLERELTYWRERLDGRPDSLELATDHPRPAVQTYRGAAQSFRLPASYLRSLNRLCQQEDATLFMTLLAALNVLLFRYSGQDDVIVGTPIANRNRKEVEALIGFFVNTLVMRSDLSGNPTFRELLGRVRKAALAAYEHQDLPFEKLVDALQLERDLMRTPLFQVCFVLQNATTKIEKNGETAPKLIPIETDNPVAKFDLTLVVEERSDGLNCLLEYNTDLFEATTIERMLGHFQRLLESIISDPSQRLLDLGLSTPTEEQLLRQWNDTYREYPHDKTLDQLFEAQVEQRPEACAVVCESDHVTYSELNRRANQVARYLQGLGVGPEVLVGICAERSIEMMVGLLGILKAGGAYVPLDPEYPKQRLTFMLKDAQTPVLLTQERLVGDLPEYHGRIVCLDSDWEEIAELSAATPINALTPDNLAYVIYTSGSTGTPKGAMNTHRAISNRLLWMQDQYQLDGSDRVLQKTPMSFDVSVWEFFWPLLNGACLVMARPGGHQDSSYLVKVIAEQRITTLHFVPTMLRIFLNEPDLERCRSLRRVICSGEALPVDVQQHCLSSLDAELHNLYGPTEAAVDVTSWRCRQEPQLRTVPIGRPIANTQIYVLDQERRPLPVGIGGELHIGGVQLARGYWKRPDLTAERFVPKPQAQEPGQRLYKTGDLARYLPNGPLEFLGRNDDQVKVHGYRIELGEIEAALGEHDAVLESAVVVHENASGRRLLAYIIPKQEAMPTVNELAAFLKRKLPNNMIPAAFPMLEALPLLPSGKVNKRALPALGHERPVLKEEYVAPKSHTEQVLAAIWSEVLEIDRIGVHDNFFAVGGDSIRSIQVVALAKERGLNFPLQQLFQYPTIGGLARELKTDIVHSRTVVHSEPFSLISEQDRQELPNDVEDAYPLTMLQAGMLFHLELTPDIAAYHNVNSIHLRAKFDLKTFRKAAQRVVARHPNLRTSFDLTTYSEPLQLVHKTALLSIGLADMRHLPACEQAKMIDNFVAAESKKPFDLAQVPQIRFHFHLCDDEAFYFTITESHAINDGWSLHATLNEIFNLYFALLNNETAPEPPPLFTSFRDFVLLEREALQSEECQRYWTEKLKDYTLMELPRWPSASHRTEGRRIRVLEVSIPQEVSERLNELAKVAEVPLKSVLLAAHTKVMSMLSGRTDLVTGFTAHGRPEQTDGEQVRGLFLNALPFRMNLPEGTWLDLVRATFDAEREMIPYRRYPFAQMQKDRPGQPLFETYFNFVRFHVVSGLLESGNVEAGKFRKIEETNFKLLAGFSQNLFKAELGLELNYDSDELCDEQMKAISEYYLAGLSSMAREPLAHHQFQCLLSPAEKQQILIDWNRTAVEYPSDACVHQLLEAQVERTPGAIAVIYQGKRLSYHELNRRANQLAHYLRQRGVGPGILVGVMMERSAEMMVAVLGVLKAGGAYVPLDPSYPRNRLQFMIEESQAPVLLTQASLLESLPHSNSEVVYLDKDWAKTGQESDENLDPIATAEDLAYMIYTSGSTGRPKGVAMPHRALTNLLSWQLRNASFTGAARTLQFASLSFDVSFQEMFSTWCSGGTLVLIPRELQRDAVGLLKFLSDNAIERLFLPFVALQQLAQAAEDEGAPPMSLRQVITAGEQLRITPQIARLFRKLKTCRLQNQYGPSESHVVTAFDLPGSISDWSALPPIGRPIANTQIYLLDKHFNPVPIGVPGELYIGGTGLAHGYGNHPELTQERFIPDPFSAQLDARLYKTGDLARYLPCGDIEYLGRTDHQVKIRGFRIELGEIESVISQHPAIKQVAVVAHEHALGDKRLVAYIVPAQQPAPAVSELHRLLKEQLPEYMVPSTFVVLDNLPLTPSGKIDRQALPGPDQARPSLAVEYLAPRTAPEDVVCAIWSEMLDLERVGIHDNFFELGGHSLLATQVISRVRAAFRVELPLRALFEKPTVAGLVDEISRLWGGREIVEEVAGIFRDLQNLSEHEVRGMLSGQISRRDIPRLPIGL